jgi:hypothetical protein
MSQIRGWHDKCVSEKTKESKKEGNQNNTSMVFLGYGCYF